MLLSKLESNAIRSSCGGLWGLGGVGGEFLLNELNASSDLLGLYQL